MLLLSLPLEQHTQLSSQSVMFLTCPLLLHGKSCNSRGFQTSSGNGHIMGPESIVQSGVLVGLFFRGFFLILYLPCFCQNGSWENAGTVRPGKGLRSLALILTVRFFKMQVRNVFPFRKLTKQRTLSISSFIFPSNLLNVHGIHLVRREFWVICRWWHILS